MTKTLVERLREIDARLPAGPWKLWTSCSFRRIGGPSGADGDVLSAYAQRSDGHPDLSMREEQLAELVELRNILPAAASRIEELERRETRFRLAMADVAVQAERYEREEIGGQELADTVGFTARSALSDKG
jgi:hypothetical protein